MISDNADSIRLQICVTRRKIYTMQFPYCLLRLAS